MDAAVSCASAGRDDSPCARSQSVDPLAGGDRLSGFAIGSKRRPITFAFVVLVGNGAFDYENKRLDPAMGSAMEKLENSSPFSNDKNGL